MSDTFCPNCKKNTEIVFSLSVGNTVCWDCGLVIEFHSIDETSEWTTFANQSGNNDPPLSKPNEVTTDFFPLNPQRSNPLSTQSGMPPVITKPNEVTTDFLDPDPKLSKGFKTISRMCDRLGLVATIKDKANEIFKKVEEQNCCKGRKLEAILSACLYIACRQQNKPRKLLAEICSVAHGVTVKEIGRVKEVIVKQVELVEMGIINAGDFMRRFCSNLGMTDQTVKAAQEAIEKCEEFDIRRSPTSIAATIIYIVTLLSEENKSLKDVVLATGVSEVTIRTVCKDIYPHLSKIIPTWYAKEENLNRLRLL